MRESPERRTHGRDRMARLLLPVATLGLVAALLEPLGALGPATTGTFLHITDLHLDPFYKVGSSPAQFCHRSDPNDGAKAGPWGDRKCDSPIWLARKMLTHVRDNGHDFDFVILTGDLARHDTDDEAIPKTPQETIAAGLMVRTALQNYFPTKPVVFAIGNNDLFVHNQLAPHSRDLKAHFLVWRHHIPRDQWESFATQGYYTIAGYDFPVDMIVLNTQFFYAPNSLVQDCRVKGSAGQAHLKWLRRQLRRTRKKGFKAYIVGHVAPSSNQYYPGCLEQFVKLTHKYADVIVSQFYGHSNFDDFFLTKATHQPAPTAGRGQGPGTFGLIAPSVVPAFNPAFRIVEYERSGADFGRLKDYHQYYMDLDEANTSGPRIRLEYQMSEAYGPGPLTAKYYRRLLKRLGAEAELMDQYRLRRVVGCQPCLAAEEP